MLLISFITASSSALKVSCAVYQTPEFETLFVTIQSWRDFRTFLVLSRFNKVADAIPRRRLNSYPLFFIW
jgi:hypothetical protein